MNVYAVNVSIDYTLSESRYFLAASDERAKVLGKEIAECVSLRHFSDECTIEDWLTNLSYRTVYVGTLNEAGELPEECMFDPSEYF